MEQEPTGEKPDITEARQVLEAHAIVVLPRFAQFHLIRLCDFMQTRDFVEEHPNPYFSVESPDALTVVEQRSLVTHAIYSDWRALHQLGAGEEADMLLIRDKIKNGRPNG